MAGTTQYFGISYPTATDYVKDGASNMQTIATGFDSAVAIPTYNNQTGTSYTFVLADAAKTVTSNNAGAVTFTIPPQSSVAWANGTTLTVRNYGAGVVTFAGGSGVTVTNTASTVAQYGSAKVVRTGSDAWTVLPDSGGATGALTLISTTTFTGSSAVNINSVFSSTYQNYKIFVTVTSATANGNLQFRLRSSGTDSTTNYSFWNFEPTSNNATVYTNLSNSANSYYCGYSTAGGGIFELNISRPFEASSSYFTHIYASYNTNVPGTTLGSGGGHNSNSTSYDGCTIFPVNGTLTGNIRVYGVQN